mgnify:CR=1 FL=1
MNEIDTIKHRQIEREARDAFEHLFHDGYKITNVDGTSVTAVVETKNGPYKVIYDVVTRHLEKMIKVDLI